LVSLYSSINAFLDIENELVNFIEKDMKCALVGDFNAKTAVLEDFSEPDGLYENTYCISCVVINCINSGNNSFDLIPQTFYF
jgi:hypothetical protein